MEVNSRHSKTFFFMLVISMILAISMTGGSTAHAANAVGFIHCDSNEDGKLNISDDRMADVTVIVESTTTSYTNSAVSGAKSFFTVPLLPSPQTYIETLDPATLPEDAVIVVPASGYWELVNDGTTKSGPDFWLIASDSCIPDICGNYVVDEGETCDPPGYAPDPDFPDNECTNTCDYCGDGIMNGNEECDFNDPDAPDNCRTDCTIEPECDIKVTKTCEILLPELPLRNTCKDIKDITSLTLIWDGPDGISIVSEVGQVINGINNGDVIVLDASKELTGNDVDITISGAVSGTSRFHISCSDEEMNGLEDCGNNEGDSKENNSDKINDWLLEGMTGKNGMFECTEPETDTAGFPTEEVQCEFIPVIPEDGNCQDIKDITSLTLIWNGPDGINIESEVGQVIEGIRNGDVIVLETPRDQTGNDVDVTISGAVSGTSRFHISCSDEEMNGIEDCGKNEGDSKDNKADKINDWLLDGMTGEKGQLTCSGGIDSLVGGGDSSSGSADVVYGFRVENLTGETMNVQITDAALGIDTMETIPANETIEMISDPVTVAPDNSNKFENTVLVTGEMPSGAICADTDIVTVKRITPPPPRLSCKDIKKITALKLKWDGPDGINIESEAGQVINGINNGDVIALNTPKKKTGNDVDVTISGTVSGTSRFHISCSDKEMNGSEDCGNKEGNSKNNDSDKINDWVLDGMTGEKGFFECTSGKLQFRAGRK